MTKFAPFRAPFVATTIALLMLLAGTQVLAATTFIVDPAKGSDDGDGTAAKPWKTLEAVVSKGDLKKLKGGDTLELESGFHGDVSFTGENESMVTIAAGKGQRPHLSRLNFSGKNWTVKGLVVSSSFAEKPYKGEMLTFGEKGESTKLVVEDCYIFTEEDSSKWGVAEWMQANTGVNMGRAGKDLTLRNCYIKNVRFGIALCSFDSLCEGNVVSDYSADGIRATRDGLTVQYNIVKNVYVSDDDGDKNHDDGIQVYLFNKGTGLVKNMKFIGNIIIAHEDKNQKFPNGMQGLGFFDGPLQDFLVTDNVVNVDTYHGISLYDAQNADVERNVVWSNPDDKIHAWLMFGTKLNQSKNNVAKDNYANSYKFDAKPTGANNKITTAEIYKTALARQYKIICDEFGADHFAADRPRISGMAKSDKATADQPAKEHAAPPVKHRAGSPTGTR